MVSRKLMINAMIVSAIFLAGCSSDGTGEFEEAFNGKIEHVHGMGMLVGMMIISGDPWRFENIP
ncbi:hypothetical protein AAT16_00025 [Salinicoccus halodurans]|uniref:Uncharacterized protein n=1 Tax=Salinicoccus halodurans TaxID=407035 RepID=A0ABM5T5F1_9STAP|nr:hypothetical protein [Salinicoccus halodurans]AKG72750.1 hypothetical protein AAT16_00025 [Salinicoccus halodurans]